MSIAIDEAKLRELVAATLGDRIGVSEIRAAVEAAQLAASIDLDDTSEEQGLLRILIARLCGIAGVDAAVVSPLARVPTDPEERASLLAAMRQRMTSPGTRELAFALAYLVIVADLELAPIEMDLLDAMQHDLGIARERAAQLVELASVLVTPGVDRSSVAVPAPRR